MMDFWRKSDDNMLKVEESICLLIHLDSEEKECFFNVILGKRCDPDLGIGTNM